MSHYRFLVMIMSMQKNAALRIRARTRERLYGFNETQRNNYNPIITYGTNKKARSITFW